MRATTAWNRGATGTGITVGVIDSGVQPDQADLVGRVSPLSTDIITGRNLPRGENDHGTFVAGVTAAGFNGFGTVGVAYNATILSVRSDISDCNDPTDTVCFASSDLARSIDYAVANGARIINLSLGGEKRLGGTFEAALQRAISAGVVFAISSGNEAGADPEFPGRYASDPRFAGAIIVVGAHGRTDQIADFSNRAGSSAASFLSAPGVDIISQCDGTSCLLGSGTSFSSPAVAGALALLLEAFPNLTGRQAVSLLLTTARDAGDPGVDTVYGQGLLDLARAFAPVGATRSPTATGSPVQVSAQPGAFLGGAFGDALSGQGGLATISYDAYDRLFRTDLGSAYPSAPRISRQPGVPVTMQSAAVEIATPSGATLSLTTSAQSAEPEPVLDRATPFNAPWLGAEAPREASLSVAAGRYGFSAWQGQGGVRSPFRTGSGDAFTALAHADRAVRGAVDLGTFTLTAETGGGDRAALLRPVEQDASTYSRVALAWQGPGGSLTVSLGDLEERLGPLGAYLPSGSDLALPSRTTFGALGGVLPLWHGASLSGEFGLGRTALNGRLLSLEEAAVSSTWRAALRTGCPGWLPGCLALTWEVSQPIRIERGTFAAELADVPLAYFDPITFSVRRFSAAPSGREINYALRSLYGLPDGSALSVEALAITQEQHRRGAPLGYALVGSWRRAF
ncbi:peptidase S8 [Brevundimonas sp. LM2]|nr:peptidase S8 [Brevundimonas sp. LM2]